MELPTVKTSIKDAQNDVIYEVLAYRQVTRQEMLQTIAAHKSQHKRKPKKGSRITENISRRLRIAFIAFAPDAENLRVAQEDHFRDAAIFPVLDSLHATGTFESQRVCKLAWAAQAIDKLGMRVKFWRAIGAHMARITRHV